MIKLIKEFFLSGIEANKSITEAMNASTKSHNKSLEWYDVVITKEINNLNLQFQNNTTNLVILKMVATEYAIALLVID